MVWKENLQLIMKVMRTYPLKDLLLFLDSDYFMVIIIVKWECDISTAFSKIVNGFFKKLKYIF